MEDPGKYNDAFTNEKSFDVRYMTDEELIEACGGPRGEITSPRIYDARGNYAEDGLFSERVFGPERGAVCNCGQVHTSGLWCSECGTKAENGWKTRMGWIRLPVGWYGDNAELVADLLRCSVDEMELCWSGKASLLLDNRRFVGPQQLESALARADVGAAIERLQYMMTRTEADLSEPGRDDYKSLENRLEGYERRIAALQSLDAAGLRPSDLMRHVMPVMPPGMRRIAEMGSDPEGRLNRAYMDVLSKSHSISAAMRSWRESGGAGKDLAVARFRNEAAGYAETLKNAIAESDLFSGKKGIGRTSQKFSVPNSFSAPAIPDKNLMVDEVSLPYRVLVQMYRDEIQKELLAGLAGGEDGNVGEEERKSARRLVESQIKVSLPSQRSPAVFSALETVLKGKLVKLYRYPVTTSLSAVALRPLIGAGDSSIGANPLICEQMGLDFDGDQPNVMKISSAKAIADAAKYFWPGIIQNSVVTGAPIHMMEREDTWGIWILTRAWTQRDMSFKRDAVITDVIERERDGSPCGERSVYARHVIADLPEGFAPLRMPAMLNRGDVAGTDASGNEIKAPCTCMLQDLDGRPALMSVVRDCIVTPPGSVLHVEKGTRIGAGESVADMPRLSFTSPADALGAFRENRINAFTPIDLDSGTGTVTTTMGRLLVSRLLSPPGSFRLFNGQMDKKHMDMAFTRLWNETMSRLPSERDQMNAGNRLLGNLKELQDLAAEYARDYGSFNTYEAYKFETADEKGVPEDKYFRWNALLDQVRSGSKGSMNNLRLFILFATGLDPVKDARFIADEVQKLDKGGKPVEGTMKPVEEAGMWQRFFTEAGSPYEIEEEDCGTTAYETVKAPVSEQDRQDAVAMLRNRTLAKDYTASDGRTWYAGDAVGESDALVIADDMARTGKTASVRTLLGCLCSGGCSKCYGLEPSTLRPIRPGSRIGIIAAEALTHPMREKMTLKATANTGVEDASATAVFGKIMEGDPKVWEAGLKYGPAGAARMTVRLLDGLFRGKAKIDVSRQNMEVTARMMVNVHVTGTDSEGRQVDDRCSYARWLREYRDEPGLRSTVRIRSMRRLAEGPWNSDNKAHIVALGGSKGRSMLAEDSIVGRAKEIGGRNGK